MESSISLLQILVERIKDLEARCGYLASLIKPFYNEWGSIEDAERTHFLLHRYFDEDIKQVIPPMARCPIHRPFYEHGAKPTQTAIAEPMDEPLLQYPPR